MAKTTMNPLDVSRVLSSIREIDELLYALDAATADRAYLREELQREDLSTREWQSLCGRFAQANSDVIRSEYRLKILRGRIAFSVRKG